MYSGYLTGALPCNHWRTLDELASSGCPQSMEAQGLRDLSGRSSSVLAAAEGVDWAHLFMPRQIQLSTSDYFITGADRPSGQGSWHRPTRGSIRNCCPSSSNSDLWSVRLDKAPGRLQSTWALGPPGVCFLTHRLFPKIFCQTGQHWGLNPYQVGLWNDDQGHKYVMSTSSFYHFVRVTGSSCSRRSCTIVVVSIFKL